MTNNPNEPTSASRAEIAAFLNELLEAERAGTTVALRSAEQAETVLIAIFCVMFTTTRRDGVPCS